ncbi:hypothetical protein BO94DRAFT_110572 [Aspergillus sclerotioniger CBS 115572]|uniref:Uncharacterized protein n=1 Tax=Aspergillus sclerotioniger CBS 115572 TaxID=1450535 RepID=A0A317WEK4_9EURO|nr:hypothetical protein BO94DRAFT_110572 [Aspergillus sclerotioniger CBS 115572]PWY84699.1 hypothetical protein BO94DRAFT_110572 [Aspergillus sclerotioniger CBS 115572]
MVPPPFRPFELPIRSLTGQPVVGSVPFVLPRHPPHSSILPCVLLTLPNGGFKGKRPPQKKKKKRGKKENKPLKLIPRTTNYYYPAPTPQNLDGWEKKFHAIPFSLWVLDAPLEWPIRGFSLCLSLSLTHALPPSSDPRFSPSGSPFFLFTCLPSPLPDSPSHLSTLSFVHLSSYHSPLPSDLSSFSSLCPPTANPPYEHHPSLVSPPSLFTSYPSVSLFLHAIRGPSAYSQSSVTDPRSPAFQRSHAPPRKTTLLRPRTTCPLSNPLIRT